MLAETIKDIKLGNAILVSPNDNIITKYNWLKSSAHTGSTGVTTATIDIFGYEFNA